MTLDQRARAAASTVRENLDTIAIPEPSVVLRRARRRRRLGRGAVAIVAAAATIAIVAGVGGKDAPRRVDVSDRQGQHATVPTTTVTAAPPVPSRAMPWIGTSVAPNSRQQFAHYLDATGVSAPPCHLPALFVRAFIDGAGGTQYLGVRVQNRSQSPCFVRGAPYLRLMDAQGRTVGERLPEPARTAETVVLVPTSWATSGGIAVASSVCGTNIAAVAFGLDRTQTRTVRTFGTPPTTRPCGGGSVGTSPAPAFGPLVGTLSDPALARLMFAALHDGTALTVPREVRRGSTLAFSVTITNTGLNSLAIESDTLDGALDGDCPIYRQSLGALTSPPLLLNCGRDGVIIPAGTTVRFDMRLAVPTDHPLGPATLRWQFQEPEEPSLTAQVVVLDANG